MEPFEIKIIIMAVAVLFMMLLGIGVWWIIRIKNRSFDAERILYEAHAQQQKLELELHKHDQLQLHKKYDALLNDKTELERDYAVLHTRLETSEVNFKEKLKLLEEAKERLSLQFENLAGNILDKKSRSFDETNQKRIELLLKPFREQIYTFSKQSEVRFLKESTDRTLLQKEISHLKLLNERISEDAINLTNALKGENKTQGNWGEIILERVLSESGLREGHEYDTQGSYRDEFGRILRPDVIVHLPQEKDIIIDAKVSLIAYERFIIAEDPSEKAGALKQHIASINAHVKGLSEKRYEKLDGIKTLDFVLLFMPIEGAFLLALEQDSAFFSRAYRSNIMIVSPSTLLTTLRTIEYIWRTERQEQNAKEIVSHAEALYDKIVGFVSDIDKIGEQIGRTQKSYDDAIIKLQGKGGIISRSEKMKNLGLSPKKSLSLASIQDRK